MDDRLKSEAVQSSILTVWKKLRANFKKLVKRIVSILDGNREIEDRVLDDMERNQSGSHICGT
jgi:hypothetical protein